ncbi:MAG TPA: hypothetical protein VGC61_06160 [Pyrinomonadaceae bacterium]
MILRNCLIAVAATLCFVGNAFAQSSPAPAHETGLALEIVYLKGKPPAYQPIHPKANPGAWYGMFGRIAGWQLPKGALPINAVRLAPIPKDGAVSVKVSVLRGEFLDTEETVATYNALENEVLTLEELKAFGVEPFVIKVIRTSTSSESPTTLNKTKSVAIVGVEPIVATMPVYKLTVQNLSDKNISALGVNIMSEGRLRRTGFRLGDYGEPLIKAGESFKLSIALAMNAETTAGGYEPSAARGQQITIESLIFEDGSYEGEIKPARQFLAFGVGEKIELKRILPLLEAALSDAAASPDSLRSQINSLSFEMDEAEVARLAAAFPSWEKKKLRMTVDASVHNVRKDLLDDLGQLQKPDTNAAVFNAWLVRKQKAYSSWLTHVDAVNLSRP